MNQPETSSSSVRDFGARFHTTSWSAVLAAAHSDSPSEALAAWERLCQTYWKPIYAYLRRLGNSHESSQDLTQDFFYHLLRRERLRRADPLRGKFRSFLLTCLNRFVHSDWDRRIAQKRDQRLVVSLDQANDDGVLMAEYPGGEPPDRIFEREWAVSLFRAVRSRLSSELATQHKEVQLTLLPAAMREDKDATYPEYAQRLGLSLENVKKIAQRLRERWQQLLREEVATVVDDPHEIEEEIRYLQTLV
jgi:RNA polymerase sigma factor (sigma-70 family)